MGLDLWESGYRSLLPSLSSLAELHDSPMKPCEALEKCLVSHS